MPLAEPKSGEDRQEFIQRCMRDSVMVKEFPDEDQRYAICVTQTKTESFSKSPSIFIDKFKTINMLDKEKLKELVKAHFNLVDPNDVKNPKTVVEEKFGSLEDINSAFTLVFPGDEPKVGDKVKVVTSEGQEVEAPNGEHLMKNGLKIETEGSVIKEISKEEEMQTEETKDVKKEESNGKEIEESFGADPEKSKVEGTMPENKDTKINADQKPDASFVDFEKFQGEVAEKISALESRIEEMSKMMDGMKGKFSAIASEPASERTLPKAVEEFKSPHHFDVETAANASFIKNALENLKKNKK